MSRYFVGQWAGGAALLEYSAPCRWREAPSLLQRVDSLHPSHWLVPPLHTELWISMRSQPEITISFGSFSLSLSISSSSSLLPPAASRLTATHPKKLFDLCEFHLAAAWGACGLSACTVRQRAIKSRRSGKSRLNRFTLMSCIARKFEKKKEKEKEKKTPTRHQKL